MVNLEKTLAAIKNDLAAANLTATLTSEGITVKNNTTGKDAYGCDPKGRVWNEPGWENEASHLDNKINYPA